MKHELKIRVNNAEVEEKRLLEIGAEFKSETKIIDTYFKQPKGYVLKIVEEERESFISELEPQDGGFRFIRRDKINNPESLKIELAEKHGIHKILRKTRKLYSWGEFELEFNLIENAGDFLILAGDNPKPEIIEKKLGFMNPEYISVPFSEL